MKTSVRFNLHVKSHYEFSVLFRGLQESGLLSRQSVQKFYNCSISVKRLLFNIKYHAILCWKKLVCLVVEILCITVRYRFSIAGTPAVTVLRCSTLALGRCCLSNITVHNFCCFRLSLSACVRERVYTAVLTARRYALARSLLSSVRRSRSCTVSTQLLSLPGSAIIPLS